MHLFNRKPKTPKLYRIPTKNDFFDTRAYSYEDIKIILELCGHDPNSFSEETFLKNMFTKEFKSTLIDRNVCWPIYMTSINKKHPTRDYFLVKEDKFRLYTHESKLVGEWIVDDFMIDDLCKMGIVSRRTYNFFKGI